MSKRKSKELTRDSLIAALEHIGYKVTNQSTGGLWRLLRLPDGTSTDYWIFGERIEHKLDDHRGGSYFNYADCLLEADDETVAVICKAAPNSTVFVQFHNFASHKNEGSHE